ncbi:DeoR family fructose operon transcriptional repressor [Motilibacter peucedani]|uniref:Lactose phosphotransferase system repressor n=1 Tax=Motilibacter peucedani TaxID=598650 RepID=A0A420XQF0_9ACTN|nr:DeoR/GlpR family DNA-binding transcription regulator [Motilibacter peucedani]RKS75490.1 DeoR family fructose operon transcriptional repressor [Motilibacter peucedani]
MSATPARGLYSLERQQAALALLAERGRLDAAELAAHLGVTTETVRRDLIALEREGRLRRVHGGAVPLHGLDFEPAVAARTGAAEEKERIARAALAHLPRGGSVLLDAGSTVQRLAELLPADAELRVFTGALPVATVLLARPGTEVHLLGGRVRRTTLTSVDEWAVRALQELNVDVAFLGTNGISAARGCTTPDPAEAAVKRAMLGAARRRVLLADSGKVGAVSSHQHAALADIDLLVTDTGLAGEALDDVRATGLALERV